jgi:protein-S-isoprenylcysteine O-methyltransferase Ste14
VTAQQFIPWLWITWWISWGIAAFVRNRTVARPAIGSVGYRAFNVIGAVLIFALFGRRLVPGLTWRLSSPIAWALVVVSAIGFAFTWWARIHLGRLWSAGVVRREGHRVIDTGPYRLVRHPIYTGICLAAFATAVIEGTAIALVGAAVLTYGFYHKARLEEQFLGQELGASYVEYARRTPMLIPFLGRDHR